MSRSTDAEFAPDLSAADRRFALVVSRFNPHITEALLDGARGTLMDAGAVATDIDVVRVPGAWELPGAVGRILSRETHDAVIALGCVIRGGTPHFDYVAGEAARGLSELARTSSVPVVFGVLTTDDEAQARARSGGAHGNKGHDAAKAAMEMIQVYQDIQEAF